MKKIFASKILSAIALSSILFSCTDKNKTENGPLSGPELKYDSIGAVAAGTGTFYGNVINSGGLLVNGKGILYVLDSAAIPTFKHTVKLATTEGTGIFTVAATALKPRTNYKVRLFARNYLDTSYSDVIDFFSAPLAGKVGPVLQGPIGSDNIEVTSNLTENGSETINSRGFVYGKATNPTIKNSFIVVDADSSKSIFSGTIPGLTPGTQYYIRSFVKNRGGVGYSTQITVTTNP